MEQFGASDNRRSITLPCQCYGPDGGPACGTGRSATGTCNIDSPRDMEEECGFPFLQNDAGTAQVTCTNDGFNGHTFTLTVTSTNNEAVEVVHVEPVVWDESKLTGPWNNEMSLQFCLPLSDTGNVELSIAGGTSDGSELTWEVDFCSGTEVYTGTGAGVSTLTQGASCGEGETMSPTYSYSPSPLPTGLPVSAPTAVPFPAPTVSFLPTPQPTYPLPTPSPCLELTMMDSYGDGWSGCYLQVYDCDGNQLTEGDGLTLEAGSELVVEICVPSGKGYMVEAFAAGQYAQETSWSLVSPNGMELLDQNIPFDGMLGDCFATDAPSPAPTPRHAIRISCVV